MTAEHAQLRDSVRGLLARSPDTLWKRLCTEIGVAGLAIPEEYGGLGATLAETAVVLGELGRSLTPSPMLGSAVLSTQALLASGDRDACRRLLPGIAGGTIAALAWWNPAVSFVDGRLSGEAHYVLDAAVTEVLLVVARTPDGLGLFEVDPALAETTPVHTMDSTRPLASIRFPSVPGRRIGGDFRDALAHVRDVALVALSAEQVGAARRCLELTVEYTKTRIQFGRPIGSFQALKHRMADLHVLVETAESAVSAALTTDDLPLAAAVAKIHCSEAFSTVAAEMVQLHGGIAITWEHDAHRYLKRAHGSAQLFGQPREHLNRLGRVL